VPVKVNTGAVPAGKEAVVCAVLVGVIAVVLVAVVQYCARELKTKASKSPTKAM
jgi:Flp pilus assembly pilin Flp